MHNTAMKYGKLFFNTYLKDAKNLKIVEIGSQNINGSLREGCPPGNEYVGLDFATGNGVDIVLQDAYSFPIENESVDIVLSSSCFEHAEFFWLSFLEVQRILKPNGLFYLNVPSNWQFHRYPVDCWRFYPDSSIALQNWGKRNGYNTRLLETFMGEKDSYGWHDLVSVYLKDEQFVDLYADKKMQSTLSTYTNGLTSNVVEYKNFWNMIS